MNENYLWPFDDEAREDVDEDTNEEKRNHHNDAESNVLEGMPKRIRSAKEQPPKSNRIQDHKNSSWKHRHEESKAQICKTDRVDVSIPGQVYRDNSPSGS